MQLGKKMRYLVLNSSSSRVTHLIFFNQFMTGHFHMHESWLGNRFSRGAQSNSELMLKTNDKLKI